MTRVKVLQAPQPQPYPLSAAASSYIHSREQTYKSSSQVREYVDTSGDGANEEDKDEPYDQLLVESSVSCIVDSHGACNQTEDST